MKIEPRAFAILFAMMAFSVGSSSHAQTSANPQDDRATLITQALDAHDAGNHDRALELANRALAIQSTGTLRGFAAREEVALNRFSDALNDVLICVRDGPAEPPSRSRDVILAWCRDQLSGLQSRIGRLTVSIVAPPPSLRVAIDGTLLSDAALNAPIVVNPGNIIVEASAPGFLSFRQSIAIQAAGSARVDIAMQRAASSETEPIGSALTLDDRRISTAARPVEGARFVTVRSPIGPAVAIVGALALLGGVASWFVADDMYGSLARRCHPGCSDQEIDRQGASINTLDVLANVGMWGGAALVAVGAILFVGIKHRELRPSLPNAMLRIGPTSIEILGRF